MDEPTEQEEDDEEYRYLRQSNVDPEDIVDVDALPEPAPLDIIYRNDWGAVPPVSKEHLCNPMTWVLLFDTGTESCEDKETCKKAVRDLQKFYMEEKGLPDIPWNFLIGGDGTVYEGRGWTSKATKLNPKAEEYDGISMDIAYIGDFKAKIPSLEATKAMNKLVDLGHEKYCIEMWPDWKSFILDDFEEQQDPPNVA